MPFVLTKAWLHRYYGSADWEGGLRGHLVDLLKYRRNTPDIVSQCLAAVGRKFDSELQVFEFVSRLQIPLTIGYSIGFEYGPVKQILELGLGEGIGTATFLSHAERVKGIVVSVDINMASKGVEKYQQFPFWRFVHADSLEYLRQCLNSGRHFDLVFADTDHAYPHTLEEMELASRIAPRILVDDADSPVVNRCIEEWSVSHPQWSGVWICAGVVALFVSRSLKEI